MTRRDETGRVVELHSMRELADETIRNIGYEGNEGVEELMTQMVYQACEQLGVEEDECVDGSCCFSSAAMTLINLWESSKQIRKYVQEGE